MRIDRETTCRLCKRLVFLKALDDYVCSIKNKDVKPSSKSCEKYIKVTPR